MTSIYGEVLAEHLRAPRSRRDLDCALEAVLFVATEPLSLSNLASLLQSDEKTVKTAIQRLKQHYRNRGIRIASDGVSYSFATAPSTRVAVARYYDEPRVLSDKACEVLALVAYLQPITGAQIAEHHGADATHVLQTLLDAGLIACSPGEDSLLFFRTTAAFLNATRLVSLDGLPLPDVLGY